MKDGGGNVIVRAKVVLVFRGPGWNNGLPATTADVIKMYSATLASPYLSRLVQYRGIRRPSLVDNSTDASDIGHLGPDPRGFLTTQVLLIDTAEIVQSVKNARKIGQRAQLGDDTLYLVIVSGDPLPVFSEAALNNAAGFHNHFTDDDGKNVTYGVSLNAAKNTEANTWNSRLGLPATLTHETVEALTDPDTSTGFRLDNNDEIADLNDVRTVQLPDFSRAVGLAAYFSDLESLAVVPTSYSFRVTFGLRPSTPLPSVRNVIGGSSVFAAMRGRLEP
jgi:hypothetical protein